MVISLELLSSLAHVKTEYDKVAGALEEVKSTGYGIVVPSTDELVLEEPEIVKQGGRYGVRLKASAPSIHMIRADIETEVYAHRGQRKAERGDGQFPASGVRRGTPRPSGSPISSASPSMSWSARI